MLSLLAFLQVTPSPASSPPPPSSSVLSSLPTDPLSLVVIVLILVSAGLILHYGRDRSGTPPRR